jgi:hypothetical protein
MMQGMQTQFSVQQGLLNTVHSSIDSDRYESPEIWCAALAAMKSQSIGTIGSELAG